MTILPQDTILCQWMDRLTDYIDYLAKTNNPLNNSYLSNLEILLREVGELLTLEEIRSNYLVRTHLCSITKERLQRAIKYAGGNYEQLKQTGCLDKLQQKINNYLEETTKDIDFELDKKETDLSGKMLYLAVTGKLTKDTYELAKRNSMASGNFAVIIDNFIATDKNHQLDPNNPLEHYKYVCQQMIDFHSGLFKIHNDQTFAANIAIFNYLTSKGYEAKETAMFIGEIIGEVYNKHNPYTDIHKVQFDQTVVEFARRTRFDQNMFFYLVENYKRYIQGLPIELKNILKRIIIEDERNPYDIYWRQVYKQNHNSAATCDYETGTIRVYQFENNSLEFYSEKINPSNMYHQLYHELGHAYDYHYTKEWGVETELISSSPEWAEASRLDEELNQKASVSEYGNNHPREDFADSIYFYLLYPEYMNCFPNRKRLLDEKFKIPKFHPELQSSNIMVNN